MSKKLVGKEGNRVAVEIKGNKSEFYVSDVDLDANAEFMKKCSLNCQRTLGKHSACFMMISAQGEGDRLTVLVTVPDSMKDRLDGQEWLKSTMSDFENVESSAEYDEKMKCMKSVGTTTMETPFKHKDTARAKAFNYLRKMGLLGDESSDEEFPDFDDL